MNDKRISNKKCNMRVTKDEKNNQTIPFVFRRVNPHLPTKEITAPYSNMSCKK